MNSIPYWKLALKSRRLGICLIAMFVVSLIIAAATFSTYSFLNVGEVVTPVAWLVPILSGVLVATGTGVDLSSFETLETGRLTRLLPFVLVVLAGASVLSIILGHTISALLQNNAAPGSLVLHSVVSTLGWSSLALISALTIGRQFSFLLPTAYFMFVTLFGYDDLARPLNWNFTYFDPKPETTVIVTCIFVLTVTCWQLLDSRKIPLLGSTH